MLAGGNERTNDSLTGANTASASAKQSLLTMDGYSPLPFEEEATGFWGECRALAWKARFSNTAAASSVSAEQHCECQIKPVYPKDGQRRPTYNSGDVWWCRKPGRKRDWNLIDFGSNRHALGRVRDRWRSRIF